MIGPILKELRTICGYTLREVADRAGMSHSALSQIERGVIEQPTPMTLRKLADVYGEDERRLMALAGYIEVSEESIRGSIFRGEEHLTVEQRQAIQRIIDLLTDRRGYIW